MKQKALRNRRAFCFAFQQTFSYLDRRKGRIQVDKNTRRLVGGTRILPQLNRQRKTTGSVMDPSDISGVDQPVFLLEYGIEETPPFILNFGMRLRLLNLLHYTYPLHMQDLSRDENERFQCVLCFVVFVLSMLV